MLNSDMNELVNSGASCNHRLITSRSDLVSDSHFDNSDCDMQLLINTCLYASANCFGSGLAQNPPFTIIKLKQFSIGYWFNCLVHKYFTP